MWEKSIFLAFFITDMEWKIMSLPYIFLSSTVIELISSI